MKLFMVINSLYNKKWFLVTGADIFYENVSASKDVDINKIWYFVVRF